MTTEDMRFTTEQWALCRGRISLLFLFFFILLFFSLFR